jgi:hypothetical protein
MLNIFAWLIGLVWSVAWAMWCAALWLQNFFEREIVFKNNFEHEVGRPSQPPAELWLLSQGSEVLRAWPERCAVCYGVRTRRPSVNAAIFEPDEFSFDHFNRINCGDFLVVQNSNLVTYAKHFLDP